MKVWIYKKRIPIYYGKLIIVFTDDFVAAGKKLKVNFSQDSDNYIGLAVRKNSKGGKYAIFIKIDHKDAHDVLAHEALHVVNYILKDTGIEICTDNDEAQAYLLGWVVSEIYKAKEKLKL